MPTRLSGRVMDARDPKRNRCNHAGTGFWQQWPSDRLKQRNRQEQLSETACSFAAHSEALIRNGLHGLSLGLTDNVGHLCCRLGMRPGSHAIPITATKTAPMIPAIRAAGRFFSSSCSSSSREPRMLQPRRSVGSPGPRKAGKRGESRRVTAAGSVCVAWVVPHRGVRARSHEP